ncbi:hypothetical protein ACLKMY_12875 [Paraburkholderia mimosarum]|uniref:hypothetical protein n=1 Tax=Paraburkholderia mimosarum TaxID=312026 RepID=UPI0039C1434A
MSLVSGTHFLRRRIIPPLLQQSQFEGVPAKGVANAKKSDSQRAPAHIARLESRI